MEQKGIIIILKEVRSDLPWLRDLRAIPGVYDAYVNPQGAVAVKIGDEILGIKPSEFQWLSKGVV
jgi:hypothetical protein